MTVRAFPAPKHPPQPHPWCRWCGGAIVHGRAKQRSRHDGREDEPNCALAYALHTDRETQFAHVEARDGRKCRDCGEAPEKWLRGAETVIWGAFTRHGAEYVDRTRYTPVERVTALELEHGVPLWSVAHLPDDERRPFFGPTNLRLLCPDCHKPKTAREAGQRGKVNRLLKGPKKSRHKLQGGGKLPSKGMGRKMESRPFAAGSRPLQSRNSFKRP